jgi:glucosamine--fructose-6-phosphate aminotransferase (isomerizing)
MCGIMGYIGSGNAVPVIIDGLGKLEYRGYDSAGIAIYQPARGKKTEQDGPKTDSGSAVIENEDACLAITKKKGRLAEMVQVLGDYPFSPIGIGHTRWATHGVPSDTNAHPHTDCSGRIALVHNGIIENYAQLRKELILEGMTLFPRPIPRSWPT